MHGTTTKITNLSMAAPITAGEKKTAVCDKTVSFII
jgi:hypothetical protein